MSKELDARFREYAVLLNHTELLAKLSGGDLIAQGAKYHNACAVMLYNNVCPKLHDKEKPVSEDIRNYENIAFLHLASDIEELRYDTTVPTFVLSDLVTKYDGILCDILPTELGPPSKTLSTRLKERLLAEIPDLQYFKRGKRVTWHSMQK